MRSMRVALPKRVGCYCVKWQLAQGLSTQAPCLTACMPACLLLMPDFGPVVRQDFCTDIVSAGLGAKDVCVLRLMRVEGLPVLYCCRCSAPEGMLVAPCTLGRCPQTRQP